MSSLSNEQIEILRKKGLTDDKIQSLAYKKGLDLPKNSLLGNIGRSLIKSETRFGQSTAGALGNILPGSLTGKADIEKANENTRIVQTNLINTIRQKKAEGKDVSKLLNALKTLDSEVNFYDILNTSTGGSLDKSAKQVFGEGLGVATDILSFGSYGKAATAGTKYTGILGKVPGLTKGVPTAVQGLTTANTFGKGFVQGAKTGLRSGSIIGSAQGLTGAMQDNKTLKQTIGQTLGGGILGGLTGSLVGGVTGGISGFINGRKIKLNAKEQSFLEDLVSPKATEKIKQQALREGRVTEQGLLTAGKITPSKRDAQLVEAVKGVVSPKNTPLQNIKSIDDTVRELNTGLKAYVAENKVPFNTNQLKAQLNAGKDELKLIFASDANAEKTYNSVVDEFISLVKNKDTSGLMDARQAFDKIPSIKKLLDSQGLAENVKKEVVHTARDMANRYVANLLPKGNQYREVLLRESKMIEVIENMAEKFAGNIGKNNLQILAQKYPVLKWILGSIGVGILGGAGVGVGSAIVSSTD